MFNSALKRDQAISRLNNIGVTVKKIDTPEGLKDKSWIMPTSDRKGMIILKTKNK